MSERMQTRSTFWLVALVLFANTYSARAGVLGYRTIKVQNGGSVRGMVRLSGSPNDITVTTGKDDKICGATVPLAKLSSGRNGGVKNAIVFIQNIVEGKPFDGTGHYLLDQKKCRYSPHIMVLPFGSPLEIVNSDKVLHNVHISELGAPRMSILNIAQPIRGQRSMIQASQIRKTGFLVATCDAGHPWMNAYIMVAEHPYYAITDEDGNYAIEDIPPGEYRLAMWHEGIRVAKVDSDRGKPIRYEYEDPYLTVSQVTIEKRRPVKIDFTLQLR